MRRIGLLVTLLWMCVAPMQAQDGLNLPTELYILLNEGVVERYGLGVDGVETITPDDTFVLDFSVSPGGNWLAYRTEAGLFMQHMYDATREVRQLDSAEAGIPPTRGRGETLVWSARGDALAYTTQNGGRVYFLRENTIATIDAPDLLHLMWSPDGVYLAAEGKENAWWVYRRDGTALSIAAAIPQSSGAAWLTRPQLILAPLDGGLLALNLAQQNQENLLLDASATYHLPQVQANERAPIVRVFRGSAEAARLIEVDLSSDPLRVTDISTAPVDVTSVQWSPSDDVLVAFQGGALALIDARSGNGFTLPITSASTYGWGPTYPPRMTGVTLPTVGHFLAPDDDGIQQVWRLPADSTAPVPLTAAPFDIREYALSPAQDRIAYVSNSQLWLADIRTPAEPQALVMLGTNEAITPVWSADGTQLYYRDRQDAATGIWRITLETGEATPFLVDNPDSAYTQPQVSPGIPAMLVNRGEALVLVELGSTDETYIGQFPQAEWIDGSQIVTRGNPMRENMTTNGLYTLDVNTLEAAPALLLPLLGDEFILLDSQVIDNGATVRVLIRNGTPGTVRVADVARAGGALSIVGDVGFIQEPRLSPDGSTVVGVTHRGGSLLVADVVSGERMMLADFSSVEQWRWSR